MGTAEVSFQRVEPDLDFINALRGRGGETLKKCFQCGTCSVVCSLSPDQAPFPRKEMAWAVWGMKDRLIVDADVWLCHQCNDCSERCPRGARPGDVLGAVRQEVVQHYAFPRFLGRWVNQPHCLPLVLGIPAALLALALFFRVPIESALGLARPGDGRILYYYSFLFPHWMLNALFGTTCLLALMAIVVGVTRYWRALKAPVAAAGGFVPAKGLAPSILSTLRTIVTHEKFTSCTTAKSRFVSHFCVLFGFVALTMVTTWVITARYNPLIQGEFVYPFGFWNPWKMLANLGGAAVLAGLFLMTKDRIVDSEHTALGSYFDWALIGALFLVTLTGFITEVLHYLRLEPHRHIAYFMHLVFAFAVLVYLPYSKLAHLAYRATAMVFSEHTGRDVGEEENHVSRPAA